MMQTGWPEMFSSKKRLEQKEQKHNALQLDTTCERMLDRTECKPVRGSCDANFMKRQEGVEKQPKGLTWKAKRRQPKQEERYKWVFPFSSFSFPSFLF